MASDGIVAICQFGGEFITKDDGSLTYTGGEAHAIDVDRVMSFDDFKSEISNVFNSDVSNMTIKYMFPHNNRTLITVSGDKDLKRMVDFNAKAVTVDVYILNKVDKRSPAEVVADPGTSVLPTGTKKSNGRQQRQKSNAASKATNRVTRSESRLANSSVPKIPVTPMVDNVGQQRLADDEKVNDSVMLNPVAMPGIDEVGPIANADNVVPLPSNTSELWDDFVTDIGQEFDNIKDFRDRLDRHSMEKGFVYKFVKNESTRVTVKCDGGNCPWRLHASRSPYEQKLTVKRLNNVHTCGGGSGKDGPRRPTRKWLVNVIKDKIRDSPECKPKELARDIYQDYGITLKYFQVWRAIADAQKELHDMYEEACTQLPWFCERILETNPGSVVTLATSADFQFRVFVSFHASLHGFEHGCRPLLFLDRIPLKTNNQVKLLAAAALDGDGGIFPVAIAAVEAETYNSWLWFIEQLKYAVTTSRTITFVSNRQNGLGEAVAQVFEDSYHAYCLLHLIKDFKAELKKGSWSQKEKDLLISEFECAAQAYLIEDFNLCIERIKSVSTDVADWVIASKPEYWSNALFRGSRYGHLSSDVFKTISTWIPGKQESSVVLMIDAIRSKLMEMSQERQQISHTWTSTLTPSMEQKLLEERPRAHKLNVLCSSDTVFEVRGNSINVVNIGSWECACKRWQITGLPCMHAIAVFDHIGKSAYDYCSPYFTSEYFRLTYSQSVHPIADVGRISSLFGTKLRPRRPRGRPPGPGGPKRKRIRPPKRDALVNHCSRCNVAGHNEATCVESIQDLF